MQNIKVLQQKGSLTLVMNIITKQMGWIKL